MNSPKSAQELKSLKKKLNKGLAVQPKHVRNVPQASVSRPKPIINKIKSTPAKIVKASSATLSSGLARMHVNVSLNGNENESLDLFALHDSGCELSILSKKAFNKLCQLHQRNNDYSKQTDVTLQSADGCLVEAFDGTQTPACGLYDIVLHFTGINGIKKAYQHTVLVHESTTHDLMLGSEFTSSTARLFEDNNYMYLVDEYLGLDVLLPEVIKELATDCCVVPLVRKCMHSIPIMTKQSICIPPNQSLEVNCRTLDPTFGKVEDPIPFEVTIVSIPYTSTPKALCYLTNYRNINIVLTNNSIDDIIIPSHTPCARLELLGNDTEVIPIEVKHTNEVRIVKINNVSIIENDT